MVEKQKKLTLPSGQDGLFNVQAACSTTGTADQNGSAWMAVRRNGVEYKRGHRESVSNGATAVVGMDLGVTVKLTGTDYISVTMQEAYKTTGSTTENATPVAHWVIITRVPGS
jgi:hypothetical protein